jgi:hypothetical protein
MATITFNIPTDNLSRVVNAIKGLYPIPKIADPNWIELEQDNPEYTEQPMINEFTDNAWAKERVRRFMKDTVKRFEQRTAIDSAKDSVSVEDDLIS